MRTRQNRFPPDPNSTESTIDTVVREIADDGGDAVAFAGRRPRDFQSIRDLIDESVAMLGSLDVMVYNSGAIWWASVEETPMKRFQLMQRVNPEGLYGSIQAALPHWKKQDWNARIIVVSPSYILTFLPGKGSLCDGQSRHDRPNERVGHGFRQAGKERHGHFQHLASFGEHNPQSIESAATGKHLDASTEKDLGKPSIFADAIMAVLKSPTVEVNGLVETDEDFLRRCGVSDFSRYSVVAGSAPRRIMPRIFPVLEVAEQDDQGQRIDSTKLARSKL